MKFKLLLPMIFFLIIQPTTAENFVGFGVAEGEKVSYHLDGYNETHVYSDGRVEMITTIDWFPLSGLEVGDIYTITVTRTSTTKAFGTIEHDGGSATNIELEQIKPNEWSSYINEWEGNRDSWETHYDLQYFELIDTETEVGVQYNYSLKLDIENANVVNYNMEEQRFDRQSGKMLYFFMNFTTDWDYEGSVVTYSQNLFEYSIVNESITEGFKISHPGDSILLASIITTVIIRKRIQ